MFDDFDPLQIFSIYLKEETTSSAKEEAERKDNEKYYDKVCLQWH